MVLIMVEGSGVSPGAVGSGVTTDVETTVVDGVLDGAVTIEVGTSSSDVGSGRVDEGVGVGEGVEGGLEDGGGGDDGSSDVDGGGGGAVELGGGGSAVVGSAGEEGSA